MWFFFVFNFVNNRTKYSNHGELFSIIEQKVD